MTASISVKVAAYAPMPRASERMATAANPRLCRSGVVAESTARLRDRGDRRHARGHEIVDALLEMERELTVEIRPR
jgi:hypothetical protein